MYRSTKRYQPTYAWLHPYPRFFWRDLCCWSLYFYVLSFLIIIIVSLYIDERDFALFDISNFQWLLGIFDLLFIQTLEETHRKQSKWENKNPQTLVMLTRFTKKVNTSFFLTVWLFLSSQINYMRRKLLLKEWRCRHSNDGHTIEVELPSSFWP